jgi:hypothetical protein
MILILKLTAVAAVALTVGAPIVAPPKTDTAMSSQGVQFQNADGAEPTLDGMTLQPAAGMGRVQSAAGLYDLQSPTVTR